MTTRAWEQDRPFTKEQVDAFNRYTHYPVDINREFESTVKQKEREIWDKLSRAGKEEMSDEVQEAYQRYRKALYDYYLTESGIRSYAPPWTVVGRAKYPTGRVEKAAARSRANLEKVEKAEKRLDSAIKRQLSQVIYAGDPEAIKKYKEKLKKLEETHALEKKINDYFKRTGKLPEDIPDYLREKALSNLKFSYEKRPFPSYELSSNTAEMRRIKKKIEEITKLRAVPTTEKVIGDVKIVENVELNRVQIFFPEKPPEEIRTYMKQNGFRWSPRNKCWQRQRSNRATYLAEEIVNKYVDLLGGIVPTKGKIVPAFGLEMKPTTHHQKQIALNMFLERVKAGEIKGWTGELYLVGSFLEGRDTEYSDVDIVMQTVGYFSPDMASDLFNIQKDILRDRGVFIDVLHKFPEEPYKLLLKVEKKPEATATFVAGVIPPELTPAEAIKAKKQKVLAEIPIEERQRREAERKHRELKRKEAEERKKRYEAILEGKKKPQEYLDAYIGQTKLDKYVKVIIFVGVGAITLRFLEQVLGRERF